MRESTQAQTREGRIGLTMNRILARVETGKPLKVGAIADAVRGGLVALPRYKECGGSDETVLGDCRRALAALKRASLAEFRGIKAQGTWTLKGSKKRASKKL